MKSLIGLGLTHCIFMGCRQDTLAFKLFDIDINDYLFLLSLL
jgi:hypothetical protein